MKVFLAAFDLFSTTGGGQTVYRRLIATHPEIDFFYLARSEGKSSSRPANAHALAYKENYFARRFNPAICSEEPLAWLFGDFLRANNIAASAAGQSFDVVELPDYEQFGLLLRPALRRHGVHFDRLALSLHGNISTSFRLDWGGEKIDFPGLEWREKVQYQAADVRYGIGQSYLEAWEKKGGRKAYCLSPLRVVAATQPRAVAGSAGPPDINFIGRTERIKGPDIFLEIAFWLPRSCYGTASIIGPQSIGPAGLGANFYLKRMIRHRGLDARILPGMSPGELASVFTTRAATFLPSRFDSFNLLALESLFSGCPTLIGSGAGVCHFLRETFPQIPFLTIDMSNVYGCLEDVHSLLRDYDSHRQQLAETLQRLKPAVSGPGLERIYGAPPEKDEELAKQSELWYGQLQHIYDRERGSAVAALRTAAVGLGRTLLPRKVQHRLRALRGQLRKESLKQLVKTNLTSWARITDGRLAYQALKGLSLVGYYRQAFGAAEGTERERSQKIRLLWELAADLRVDRIRLWREISRLERLRGNGFMAAAYAVRVMRILGEDRFGELPFIASALGAEGLGKEAKAAQALFGPADKRRESCGALLKEAEQAGRCRPEFDGDFELKDERRSPGNVRVSIIVSLYNAAYKLVPFLGALLNQTMVKSGQAELIFIDSASPADEYRLFKQSLSGCAIAAVYARTRHKETIQCAWNRGISMSRAPYLCFLGVDETILPDGLEILAAELDSDPTLDWVQSNSLVTQVDSDGTWRDDIMIYDRSPYRQDLVYLEKCYMSWVGALYRRSIHDRFGYYDPSFAAAGDTEFKLRVLPFIKSKFIPKILGIFWNYPDERASHGPRSEIEDLRAWYLHRSLAGVHYAFCDRNAQDVEALFCDSLRYRKSYCRHLSTDVEYALHLADFLRVQAPHSPVLKHAEPAARVLAAYRDLERLPVSRLGPLLALSRASVFLSTIRGCHAALGREVEPQYGIFNDNRYEEHANVWRSKESL
ncbi:MAG: hypothetical protein A3J74_11670 [Elusimicrobia bacterium RIFCSPHIGHO2_02_FULL_57_9]|nr:MAG: hypothetical protein A3J74_11670 [Elusimicrobia bacterium RIFCSPHIGHO2_02_FULL_57_9]